MRKLAVLMIAALASLPTVYAQEEVFQRGIEFGIGSRAMGMGGAYLGVSDDYSASFWNPAALTQIRRLEGFVTLSHSQFKDDATYLDLSSPDEASYTRFNSLGLAYPIPTYRGSMVFSLGFHRVRPYDSNFGFEWFNGTEGDSVNQRWSELEEGSLNTWTLAGASEIAPTFSVGAALNLWTGENDYQSSFVENDVLDLYTFNRFRSDDNLVSKFSGFNLKLAALYRANSMLRVGATLSTPITYKVTDSWETYEETTFEDGGDESERDGGEYEYKIRSPFSVAAGASLNLAGLLVSGSAEVNDWSRIRYTTEPPIEGLSRSEANDEISQNYRSTMRVRLGAEFTVPIIDLQLRAGYFLDPSPLNDLPSDADREFLTAGVGIFLDKQARLDLAVMTGEWREYKEPLDDLIDDLVPVSEKIRLNKAMATLAFRF